MKILLKGRTLKHKLFLIVPSSMLFSRISATIALHYIKKHIVINVNNESKSMLQGLSPNAVKAVFKEMRSFHRKCKNFVLVEVFSADGYYIKITI